MALDDIMSNFDEMETREEAPLTLSARAYRQASLNRQRARTVLTFDPDRPELLLIGQYGCLFTPALDNGRIEINNSRTGAALFDEPLSLALLRLLLYTHDDLVAEFPAFYNTLSEEDARLYLDILHLTGFMGKKTLILNSSKKVLICRAIEARNMAKRAILVDALVQQ